MYRKMIQDSIDYIEDNIKCDISAQELSENAGFSVFHYYRLFQTAVGLPVMQYILRRRLLNAIYVIVLEKHKNKTTNGKSAHKHSACLFSRNSQTLLKRLAG